MNAMELMATIGLDSKSFDKGLDTAGSNFSKFGKSLASGAKKVGKVAVASFAAVGAATVALGKKFIDSAGQTAVYADNIDKMSQKLGMSAKAYQEWDYVLKLSGTEMSAISTGLKTLTNKLDDAKNGSKDATAMFEKLGLSLEDISQMSREELFGAVISGFQGMEDSAERAALANDLFGKSGQELAPLFNTTTEETQRLIKEVNELGGVMSDDAVKAGAKYQDSLLKLKTSFGGLKNSLMTDFLPSMSQVMDGLAKLFSGNSGGIEDIQNGIKNITKKITQNAPKIVKTIGGVIKTIIEALPEFFDEIGKALPDLLNELIPVITEALVSLAQTVSKVLPRLAEVIKNNIGVLTDGIVAIIMAIADTLITVLPIIFPAIIEAAVQIIVKLADAFSKNADQIVSGILDIVDAIISVLTNPDIMEPLLDAVVKILEALTDAIEKNQDKFENVTNKIVDGIVDLIVKALPKILKVVLELLWTVVKGLVTAIGKALWDIGLALGQLLKDLGHQISQGMQWVDKKLEDFFVDLIQSIKGGLKDAWNSISNWFSSTGESLRNTRQKLWDWFGELKDYIWNGLKDFGSHIKNGFANFGKWIVQAGKNMVEGLWNGIKDAGSWIKNKLSEFGSGIKDKIKSIFGINSPSKWMRDNVGKNLALGIGAGFDENAGSVFGSMQKSLESGMDGLSMGALNLDAIGSVSVKANADTQQNSIRSIMDALAQFVQNGQQIVIPVHIGDKQIDEIYVDSRQRLAVRSGGAV